MPATPKKASSSATSSPAGTPSRLTRAQAKASGVKVKTPSPLKSARKSAASSTSAADGDDDDEEESTPSKTKAASSSSAKSSPKNSSSSPSPSKKASSTPSSPAKVSASLAKLARKPTSALATAEPITAEYSDDDVAVEDEDEEDSDIEEGQDVSEKGMQRLMKALGEDGLDEVDMAALEEIGGDDDVEDEEDEDDEDEEEDDEQLIDDEALEGEDDDEDEDEDEEHEDDEDLPRVKPSTNGDTLAASIARSGLVPVEESDDEEEDEVDADQDDEDENEQIAYEDLPDDVEIPEAAKASRTQRIKVNNESALRRIYEDIRLDSTSSSTKLPWIETMRVSYPISISAEVTDAENDLERELAFYKQALHAAVEGRNLVEASGTVFSRPSDFFAEMVKTDDHMERIRQKLLDESAAIKASEAAKKQRELKKFGKKVQVEKLEERLRKKKEMNEKIQGLKRKHGSNNKGDDGLDDGDEFDVRLEEALTDRPGKKFKSNNGGGKPSSSTLNPKAKMPRTARDAKYGFGGKKKYSKSNTAESTNDFSIGPTRGARGSKPLKGKSVPGKAGFRPKQRTGAAKRPGKARRAGQR